MLPQIFKKLKNQNQTRPWIAPWPGLNILHAWPPWDTGLESLLLWVLDLEVQCFPITLLFFQSLLSSFLYLPQPHPACQRRENQGRTEGPTGSSSQEQDQNKELGQSEVRVRTSRSSPDCGQPLVVPLKHHRPRAATTWPWLRTILQWLMPTAQVSLLWGRWFAGSNSIPPEHCSGCLLGLATHLLVFYFNWGSNPPCLQVPKEPSRDGFGLHGRG